MSIHSPTPESLKEKAKLIRKFLNEKYNVEVSQGHGLEMVSQVFGFADWNTASAALKPKEKQTVPPKQDSSPIRIKTPGDLMKALAAFNVSVVRAPNWRA